MFTNIMIILVKSVGLCIMIESIMDDCASNMAHRCNGPTEAVTYIIDLITSPDNDVTLIMWNLESGHTNTRLGEALSHENCKVVGFMFVYTYACNANMVDMLCKKVASGTTRMRVLKISKSKNDQNIAVSNAMNHLATNVPSTMFALDYSELGATHTTSGDEIDMMVRLVRCM